MTYKEEMLGIEAETRQPMLSIGSEVYFSEKMLDSQQAKKICSLLKSNIPVHIFVKCITLKYLVHVSFIYFAIC